MAEITKKSGGLDRRRLLVLAGCLLLVLAVVLVLSLRSGGDNSGQPGAGPARSPGPVTADGQPPASSLAEEVIEGPPLQELLAYTALAGIDGYVEQSRRADEPPLAAAVRFRVPDRAGFFWLSLLEENSVHYVDPDNNDPPYNKKLYSEPLVDRSCHVMLSDNETFILRHIPDTPPTAEDEIVASQAELIPLLVVLGVAGIENLQLVQPIPDSNCWDPEAAKSWGNSD